MQVFVLKATRPNKIYQFSYLKLGSFGVGSAISPGDTTILVNRKSGITVMVNNHANDDNQQTCNCQLFSFKYRPHGSKSAYNELYFNSDHGSSSDSNFKIIRPNDDNYIGLIIDNNTENKDDNSWDCLLSVKDLNNGGKIVHCDPQIKNDPSQG